MSIGYRKEIRKLTFRASALHRSEWRSVFYSDEGLTLEMSAFDSLYGVQFTLSTQLYFSLMQHHSFFRNLPFYSFSVMFLNLLKQHASTTTYLLKQSSPSLKPDWSSYPHCSLAAVQLVDVIRWKVVNKLRIQNTN